MIDSVLTKLVITIVTILVLFILVLIFNEMYELLQKFFCSNRFGGSKSPKADDPALLKQPQDVKRYMKEWHCSESYAKGMLHKYQRIKDDEMTR
jgi:hypothetical protein